MVLNHTTLANPAAHANHTTVVIQPLLNYALYEILLIINLFVMTCPLSIFGLFSNTANIIVYSKMGFAENTNINFLALSVFDLLISGFSMVGRGLFCPLLATLENWPELLYLGHSLGLGLLVMVCGSAMTTTLISAERCVCVVFPLKVKTLLTRERSLFLTLAVVTYHVIFLILLYVDTGPPYDAHPKKLGFYYFVLYVIPTTTCFFTVVMTTIFLVIRLRRNLQWRKETAANQSARSSDKENKLVRTIIAISTLFIICSFPNVGIFIVQTIYPEFHVTNPYMGTFITLMFDFGLLFQSISSSVNIFFYYTMSSRYKKVFDGCFSFGKKEKAKALESKEIL